MIGHGVCSPSQPRLGDVQRRVLEYLGARAGTIEHLSNSLGIPEDELRPRVESLVRQGLVNSDPVIVVGDPSSEITVYLLTDEGVRRSTPHHHQSGSRCRATSSWTELEKRLVVPRHVLEMNPNLRPARFNYWPAFGGYSAISEST